MEFTAPPGVVLLPRWMMQTLFLVEGDRVTVSSVKLARATSVRLQPVRYAFSQLPNPKGVLESSLGLGYTTLTRDTTISVACGPRDTDVYELVVMDVQPTRCAYVLGSSVAVEFDEPQEPPSNAVVNQVLALNDVVEGSVAGNAYSYYELKNNPAMGASSVVIEVQSVSGDPDVVVSQATSHPSLVNFTWSGLQVRRRRCGVCVELRRLTRGRAGQEGGERIVIRPDDAERKKTSFYISVRGHREEASYRLAAFLEEPVSQQDLLEYAHALLLLFVCVAHLTRPRRSSGVEPVASVLRKTQERPTGVADSVQCTNCSVWLPAATAFRHEGNAARACRGDVGAHSVGSAAFCKRNVFRCAVCQAVVQTAQKDFHWHWQVVLVPARSFAPA